MATPRLPQDDCRWGSALAAIVGITFLIRLWNLGTFSLWLDEVITLRFAALPFDRLLAACAGDAENVPLYAVVAFLASRAGLAEPWIRMPYIVFGTAGVAVLMFWVRERLGTTAALTAGAFAALSPFHVRFSQEMRAYSILLLLIPLCLLVTERLARAPGWRPATLLTVLVVIGGYTHLTFWIVIPVLLAVSTSRDRGTNLVPRPVRLAGLAVSVGGLAFVPWIVAIWQTLGTRLERGGTDWSLAEIGVRWHALTGAAREGLAPTLSSAVLALVFLIGLVVLVRNRRHRWVMVAGLGAWLVWEAVLAAVGHWSDARYGLTLWFLMPLSLGAAIGWVTERFRRSWVRIVMYGAMVMLVFPGTWRYWHEGRPHWDILADTVRATARTAEPIIAANEWSRVCLSWYLSDRRLMRPVDIPGLGGSSFLVVSGGLLPSERVDSPRFNARTTIARIRQTGWMERLAQRPIQGEGPPSWWLPYTSLVPPSVAEIPRPAPERWLRLAFAPSFGPVSVVSLDFGETLSLTAQGFGPPQRRRDGSGFAWVIGNEAAVQLPTFSGAGLDVELTLRPFHGVADRQWVRMLIGGRTALEQRVAPGTQTISVAGFPTSQESEGPALILQFSASARPSDLVPGSSDSRNLAAAIEVIEVTARP
ncbi:MAG: glycosyltransferase family 39 protein [Thermoanaerobaculales bacterium]|nr:glycosyltransferase family 39 protein [Thermoanaerobaculales bacterium]